MRKISFFLTLILLLLSVAYVSLPPDAFASFKFPFLSNKVLSEEEKIEKIKEIRGQISSYIEVHPQVTTVPAKDENSAIEDVSEGENNKVEFEVAENKEVLVRHEGGVAGDSEEEYIIGEVNKYRAEFGLAPVSMNSEVCSFAALRAAELKSNYSHEGFRARIEGGSLPYSSYTKVTENIAENYPYTEVVNAWRNSSGHAENMRADTPFVCVKRDGIHHAYEGWRP